jgi:multimeric flavodoxin WrbA
MGDGDEWPRIREQILASDILVLATPIWLGHPASLAQKVLERLDAELSETDGQGRPSMYDKVALVAVVGNEDGAHHVTAELYQGLGDVRPQRRASGIHPEENAVSRELKKLSRSDPKARQRRPLTNDTGRSRRLGEALGPAGVLFTRTFDEVLKTLRLYFVN